uniref:helix-turn-helix transcriptional regulator n=1 Tax=Nonomuraea bangladeshensis TaxID=404385 RepID=UPI003F492993
MQHPRAQLRDFLRACRARLTPADVGMASAGRRRTPGLRREEVAELAGVGVSWYTWLEQGRNINVSPTVLDAISRALRLSAPERVHLYLLTGLNPPRDGRIQRATVPTELLNLLDAWRSGPALLQDKYWNIVASNDAARTVFGYDDTDRNCLISFFTNARYRSMYEQWVSVAPSVVAAFRADVAYAPDDPEYIRVIDDLSVISPEFTELWTQHEVGGRAQTVKALHHPDVGDLVFDKTTLSVADNPNWRLELYNPRPATDTRKRLAQLLPGRHDVLA